jgi:recombination protein RecR
MSAGPLDDLIAHLSRLPGIGERTATRLAFYLLRAQAPFRKRLAESLLKLSDIILCDSCRTVTDHSPCMFCSSSVRNHEVLCIVEKPSDIYSIERLNKFHGDYFVLHGLLSPLEGIMPEDLGLERLEMKIKNSNTYKELILALNPTVEGDATASYISKVLEKMPISISRLASGLAVGSELEYADQITLGKAFEGRTRLR